MSSLPANEDLTGACKDLSLARLVTWVPEVNSRSHCEKRRKRKKEEGEKELV